MKLSIVVLVLVAITVSSARSTSFQEDHDADEATFVKRGKWSDAGKFLDAKLKGLTSLYGKLKAIFTDKSKRDISERDVIDLVKVFHKKILGFKSLWGKLKSIFKGDSDRKRDLEDIGKTVQKHWNTMKSLYYKLKALFKSGDGKRDLEGIGKLIEAEIAKWMDLTQKLKAVFKNESKREVMSDLDTEEEKRDLEIVTRGIVKTLFQKLVDRVKALKERFFGSNDDEDEDEDEKRDLDVSKRGKILDWFKKFAKALKVVKDHFLGSSDDDDDGDDDDDDNNNNDDDDDDDEKRDLRGNSKVPKKKTNWFDMLDKMLENAHRMGKRDLDVSKRGKILDWFKKFGKALKVIQEHFLGSSDDDDDDNSDDDDDDDDEKRDLSGNSKVPKDWFRKLTRTLEEISRTGKRDLDVSKRGKILDWFRKFGKALKVIKEHFLGSDDDDDDDNDDDNDDDSKRNID